jgi:dihydrofolate synthase/folylpolyglutamate synthase
MGIAANVHAWLDTRINYERNPPGAKAAFGLHGMRRLLAAIGNPHRSLAVVHVAGTKGKGSTVAMLAAILEEAGYRTGRYMSPHVHSLEERICVDGRSLSGADLVAAARIVKPAVEALDVAAARRGACGVTWFEIVTALAFVHFTRVGVDIAVLETGLGGRLDATNVVRPLVSVITSISLDHVELLGHTVAKIAGEKAGIIKRGCPVVSGAEQPSACHVIAEVAARRRSKLLQRGRDFRERYEPAGDGLSPGVLVLEAPRIDSTRRVEPPALRLPLGMAGRHQSANAALAAVAAMLLPKRGFPVPSTAIARGLARAHLPARIETLGLSPLVIVDAAHNVASMESLVETVHEVVDARRPRVLVFAASRDKQIAAMLAVARKAFDHVVITRSTSSLRAATFDALVAACREAGFPSPKQAKDPATAIALAVRIAGREGSVVAAGSFFLAGEIRTAAGATRRG